MFTEHCLAKIIHDPLQKLVAKKFPKVWWIAKDFLQKFLKNVFVIKSGYKGIKSELGATWLYPRTIAHPSVPSEYKWVTLIEYIQWIPTPTYRVILFRMRTSAKLLDYAGRPGLAADWASHRALERAKRTETVWTETENTN